MFKRGQRAGKVGTRKAINRARAGQKENPRAGNRADNDSGVAESERSECGHVSVIYDTKDH